MIFTVYLREAWKNITKKPLLSTLTILFLTFTVLFFCVFVRISDIKTITTDNFQKSEAYIQYKQYNLTTTIKGNTIGSLNATDPFTYMYPPDEDEVELRANTLAYFDEFSDFFDTLFTLDSEDIKVVYMGWGQTTLIENYKGAKDLEESYNKKYRREEISDYKKQGIDTTFLETGAYVHTIYVGKSFFEYEKLNFAQGGVPTEEDLEYKFIADEETPVLEIPVIVGSAFGEDYEVGDILSPVNDPYMGPLESQWKYFPVNYRQEYCARYRIVGILSADNAISNSLGSTISDFSKYIIAPYHFLTDPAFTEKYTDNQKIVLLDDLIKDITKVKLYINREKEAECVSILWDMIDNSSLKDYLKPHTFDVLNEISITIANARDTSYKVLAIAIAVFCSIGVFIMILNNQKDNIRDYSVHMISGASKADILLTGVVETLIYVLIADILMQYPRIYMMFGWQQNSPLGTWMGMWSGMIPIVIIENLVIILIAFICNYISVSKISFSEVLKRKD